MKRLGLIVAASLLVSASIAQAGELDAEYGSKPSLASKPALAPVVGNASGELDSESPDQACCWRKRFYGYGYGCHRPFYSVGFYGGYGYGGFGGGGFGGYGGYGGFGGGYAGLGYGGYGGGYGYGGMGW